MRAVTIRANTGRDAVLQVCRAVLADGREVSPRGQRTKELSPVHVELADPCDTLPDGINRARLLPALGVAEALQNLAGVAQPHLMSRISSFFPKPTSRWDKGVANYGERIGRQLHDAHSLLLTDPDTREAVVSIWRNNDMIAGQAHNLCTVSIQFLVREGALDMLVYMRSNDAWYGLCYDLFQFAQVQASMANALSLPVGRYFHTAASMHLYERHWDVASRLQAPHHDHAAERRLGLRAYQGEGWYRVRKRALSLLRGELPKDASPTEAWYHESLAPYDPDGT